MSEPTWNMKDKRRKVVAGERWVRGPVVSPWNKLPEGTIITITAVARPGHSSRLYKVDGEDEVRETNYFTIQELFTRVEP